MSALPSVRASGKPAGEDRIVVGGVDVTYWRGAPTPFPSYSLMEPFAYGAISLSFPQINLCFEQVPSWAVAGKRVKLQRVFSDGSIVTDYVGVVVAARADGIQMTLDVGGEVTGRAALVDNQAALFRRLHDIGLWMYFWFHNINVRFTPHNGPVTGIEVPSSTTTGDLLSWMQQVCASAQRRNGDQWTVMPQTWGAQPYEMVLKDRTTKHLTLYMDGVTVAPTLVDDASEQPNSWFGTGISDTGVQWRNGRYPGLIQGAPPAYPMANGASFGIGATDASTSSGNGVTVLQDRLLATNYVHAHRDYAAGVYDQVVADAVSDLQDDAGLTSDGTMTPATWSALWDLNVVGYSTRTAHIFPLIQDPAVRKWNYTANGFRIGKNPKFDASVLRVDRTIDFGPGVDKAAGRDWCRGQQARADGKNWTGTIRLNGIGAISGVWDADTDGTVVPAARIMSYRDIRPGTNAWLPGFDGGTLVHIAGVDVDATGATLTVDTQARDRMELAAIIARNREARRKIHREWIAANQGRGGNHGLIPRSEFSGRLFNDVSCPANTWTIIPIIAGQQGSVSRIDLHTANAGASFCCAVFGSRITVAQLNRRVGDPFPVDSAGQSVWQTKDLADWFDDRILLYSAGDANQPCGYWPKMHTNAAGQATSAPITGAWRDDAGFNYITPAYDAPFVYLAIYPDRDTTLRKGQLLYMLESAP